MRIKIGILGYGNLGRGVEAAIKMNDDMKLVAVYTRRSPESLTIRTDGVPGDIAVYSLTGEGSDIEARGTGQVNLKLVTTAAPDAPRACTIQYYIYGMERTITVR